MRLHKYLAQCGIASRRKSEDLIANGKVKVNGITVTAMGIEIDPSKDIVSMKGSVIKVEEHKHYILFFKPKGVITTLRDPKGRRTVISFFKDIPERIFPVGRLDFNTEGLLILTNDGLLANHLTHPRHQVDKIYTARIDGMPSKNELELLENGIYLDGRKTAPAKVRILNANQKESIVRITIHEGRNRQIRRMFETAGYNVKDLRRDKIGKLTIDNLKPGQWRYLTADEVQYLYSL